MSKYTSTTVHEGGMRCRNEFTQARAVFHTDVAAALGGRGEHPTPAALLAATVASCMVSMMVFLGGRRNMKTEGISIESGYEEGKNGIAALVFNITVPHATTAEERAVLEAAVKGCPVGAAIAPTVEKKISWNWAE